MLKVTCTKTTLSCYLLRWLLHNQTILRLISIIRPADRSSFPFLLVSPRVSYHATNRIRRTWEKVYLLARCPCLYLALRAFLAEPTNVSWPMLPWGQLAPNAHIHSEAFFPHFLPCWSKASRKCLFPSLTSTQLHVYSSPGALCCTHGLPVGFGRYHQTAVFHSPFPPAGTVSGMNQQKTMRRKPSSVGPAARDVGENLWKLYRYRAVLFSYFSRYLLLQFLCFPRILRPLAPTASKWTVEKSQTRHIRSQVHPDKKPFFPRVGEKENRREKVCSKRGWVVEKFIRYVKTGEKIANKIVYHNFPFMAALHRVGPNFYWWNFYFNNIGPPEGTRL